MRIALLLLAAQASTCFGAYKSPESKNPLPENRSMSISGPSVCNGYNVYATADFIWWCVAQGGMEYALSGFGGSATGDPNLLANPPEGEAMGFHEPYKPGFKVGLGWNTLQDGWDLFANYTWLRYNHIDDATVALTPSSTVSLWLTPSRVPTYNLVTRASSEWSFHLNVIDLELGKNFFASRFLSLRPFIGLKGSWQTQNYDIDYFYVTLSTGANPSNITFIHQKIDFWGIGLRSGLNSDWHINRYFGLYGDIGLSALWSHFKVRRFDDAFNTTTGAAFVPYNIKTKTDQLTPVFEYGLGVQGEGWWCRERYRFSVRAGWEQQVWLDMNQFDDLQDTPYGNLGFQGLTASARFDF